MRRGFKAECERRTTDLRRALHLLPHDPLPAQRLALHMGVLIVDPRDIPGMNEELVEHLLVADASGWSAVTIETLQGLCIIYNPSHSPGRHESDLMHEMAHLLLEHEPSLLLILPAVPVPLRSFTEEQEEEARWLGACLQLPREALLRAIKSGKDNQDIALDFGASRDQVAGHSLRAGLATAAAAGGAPERAIMRQTGHRSVEMVRRYIRSGSLFQENAAAYIGL